MNSTIVQIGLLSVAKLRLGGAQMNDRAADLSTLAGAVRTRRLALGLRQRDLADLADCSERFVHMLEHAKPTVQLEKVLDVLEVLGLGLTVRPGDVTESEPATRR
jgi:y4mF family transcriptional regulator